jgi:hypothetical protein
MGLVEAAVFGSEHRLAEPRKAPGRSGERLSDIVAGPAEAGGLDTGSGPLDSGEHRLRWAVLIDAIEIYSGGRSPGLRVAPNRHRERERGWFLSNDTSSPFSFVSICDALGLDPGYVRRVVFQPRADARSIRRKLSGRGVRDMRRRQFRGRPQNSARHAPPLA